MKKNLIIILSFFAIVLLLAACADANPYIDTVDDPPGFFSGFWHGLILPIDFVISLFSDEVGIYSVNNNGHWYDFGFVLGIIIDIFGLNKISD